MRKLTLLGLLLSGAAHAAPVWQDRAKSPAVRAAALEQALTTDEKLSLVHGIWPVPWTRAPGEALPAGAVPGAGYVPGVPRLGIPALTETDASLGVSNPSNVRAGDFATALPSGLAMASTFDPDSAYRADAMIAGEARAKGFNVLLTGGVNLARDPRNGRNFEYYGEDPLLSGLMGGAAIRGAQSQHVIATVKHFALNDSETNRNFSNSVIAEAPMRESDLLAFEIAIEQGHPASVMCGYNLVNGAYDCGNAPLLDGVLKGDWQYPGFVMSDWGAVKATDFALDGLDQQSAEETDKQRWFGAPLAEAVRTGHVPDARLSDMVRRILYGQIASGAFDAPVAPGGTIDYAADAAVSRQVATAGMVLLKNDHAILPLARSARTILVIGDYVEKGVMSGGGSSNVIGKPDQPAAPMSGETLFAQYVKEQYHPSPPLAAIRARAPQAHVLFDNGRNAAEAARKAKLADLVIVFGNQWMTEDSDAPNIDLPRGQDAMIAGVAAANPHTVVVLQTGGPVAMPWLDHVPAVLEAWYSGQQGGEAIADILFGDANPSGRLPITFPRSIAQTPRPPVLDGADLPDGVQFDVRYPEGADIGYRWFAKTGQTPLFAFGHGLSYTRFRYADLVVRGGKTPTASFTVTNVGDRAGADVPQLYLTRAPGGPARRLLGFRRVMLAPGASQRVQLPLDARLLSRFDPAAHAWSLDGGTYRISLSQASDADQIDADVRLAARRQAP
ncbi:beta-glucosidase family protein [Sphingomonas abietis]|uniref:Glycoside hydrolase family 3 C-terminal domain-containing protein n=1 Tax=Sphingomonas abietis TaxID=3012344 RepID=A0ABY7NKA5_9SPHN|nr:glycoside hydrolase family 3 C-terminal domain-containing protein [Sphingomonas abietis]WBO21956.1 glycoside hydrolase family 3 C-terminal domain-containing protein [Sphingomonas abietis]